MPLHKGPTQADNSVKAVLTSIWGGLTQPRNFFLIVEKAFDTAYIRYYKKESSAVFIFSQRLAHGSHV